MTECRDCGSKLTRHERVRCAACRYQRDAWETDLAFNRADDMGLSLRGDVEADDAEI